MPPTMQFLGGAGTVTGSRTLVEGSDARLLVDCGLFQGAKSLRERNWRPLEVRPAELDAVFLTHAHLDHSGALPRLVAQGYRGPVYASAPTADLLGPMLLDAAHLQEMDAAHANRRGYSKHRPALPLFTTAQAEAALRRVRGRGFDQAIVVSDRCTAILRPAGHLLGASSVLLRLQGERAVRTVLLSGDVGRFDSALHPRPARLPAVDYLVLESTYGDRAHPARDPGDALEAVVADAVARGGALVVPAFSVGRTQEVLWILRRLEEAGRIPALPVFVDSPLAIAATEAYLRHARAEGLAMVAGRDAADAWPRRTAFLQTRDESRPLNHRHGPFVVIAGAGMATGGRVLWHLQHRLPNPADTVLFVGFQPPGTRGRSLVDGAPELKIHGRYVPVRARVVSVDVFSGHADRDDLLRWVAEAEAPPGQVFVNHGEPGASAALVAALRERGLAARAAGDGERVLLV